ncbi:MAG TPA: beta-propeller fold lactonase family protein [Ilumatobacteraceae bacterium]|nr:beta-propeller fold lactonase family protein [Ilumatobacteraceae bacterium]
MIRSRYVQLFGALLVATAVGALGAAPASADDGDDDDDAQAGHVFEATNQVAGNAIQVFDRASDGTLTVGPLVSTGGLGSGDSLGSQGAVISADEHVLVVNAGDNTVSSFELSDGELELSDVAPSGGVRPVSVTVSDDMVFVLNAGSDSISGLRLDDDGDLRPIPDSTLPLSGRGVGGAQIQFNERGDTLVVTEKTTAKIDLYRVGRRGSVTGPTVVDSVGAVPFGFDIDRKGHVVVSEAAPGAVSSYQLRRQSLNVITPSLPDTQAAACWLEISADGRFAYTTNAASSTISSYSIARDGSLTLVAAVAATTSAGPTDIAQSSDGAHLYVRMRSGSVGMFAVNGDGTLTSLGEVAGAASIGTSGLAAD